MSEHSLILEFYKPTYNLDFDYNGDGGLDLHFTNIKGEFFMTMNNSYDSVYFEDEDCEFSKGEMFATVDLGDLVERIVTGEFRQTNGKAVSDWGKRFIGDDEEQIEFNGKNYADGSLFWDDFFKEMPKDEIKDFLKFCEDYLYLPNIEVDTVSNKWDFENGKVELKSNDKWGIGISDDYNIIVVDEFTCDSEDAFVAYDVASSESDEDDFYESKKSARKSLKERGRRTEFFDIQHLSGSEWVAYPYDKEGDDIPYDKIEYTSDGHFYAYVGDKIVDKDSHIYYKYRDEIIDAIEDDGYEIYIDESKKSARKSLKESISDDDIIFKVATTMKEVSNLRLDKEFDYLFDKKTLCDMILYICDELNADYKFHLYPKYDHGTQIRVDFIRDSVNVGWMSFEPLIKDTFEITNEIERMLK